MSSTVLTNANFDFNDMELFEMEVKPSQPVFQACPCIYEGKMLCDCGQNYAPGNSNNPDQYSSGFSGAVDGTAMKISNHYTKTMETWPQCQNLGHVGTQNSCVSSPDSMMSSLDGFYNNNASQWSAVPNLITDPPMMDLEPVDMACGGNSFSFQGAQSGFLMASCTAATRTASNANWSAPLMGHPLPEMTVGISHEKPLQVPSTICGIGRTTRPSTPRGGIPRQKTHVCTWEDCAKAFATAKDLKRHTMVHNKKICRDSGDGVRAPQKYYVCPVADCKKKRSGVIPHQSRLDNFARHMANLHPKVSYQHEDCVTYV